MAAIWKELLPPAVKAAVAGLDLKTEFDQVVKKADDVFNAVKTASAAQPVAVVAPGKSSKAKTVDLDTSAEPPALDQINKLAEQIAAFNKA